MTFAERLEEYRKGLQWREDYDDFIDSLDGRGGICARDAAEEYADVELTKESAEQWVQLTEVEHLGPGSIAA